MNNSPAKAVRLTLATLFTATMTLLLAACATPTESPAAGPKLAVMNCGELTLTDISAFGLSNDDTDVRDLFVPCYLVEHNGQTLLWDAGLPLGIVGAGEVPYPGGGTLRYEVSVLDQLAEMGYAPSDIDFMALSHLHFDHAGAANLFSDATLLIQRPEYEEAFLADDVIEVFDPSLYSELQDSEKIVLDGDHDVFGDGEVRILAAYGHTPGHQVLFVNLANTGPVVLSGDLYHFRFSRENRRTPVFNTDRAQTLAAMDKIEAFLEESGATLWIEHDKAFADTLKKAPAFYD